MMIPIREPWSARQQAQPITGGKVETSSSVRPDEYAINQDTIVVPENNSDVAVDSTKAPRLRL